MHTVDVVKTRIQLHGTGEWAYPALLRLMREEGISGMYKGESGHITAADV